MKYDLIQIDSEEYQILCDNKIITVIDRKKNEDDFSFKKRAIDVFDDHVSNIKKFKNSMIPNVIRSSSI